jgi:GNAT superfamily N-acetyltransferase
MATPYTIELARTTDLPHLPQIEREAAALFAGWAIPLAVLTETTPPDEFREAQEAGLLWVARGLDRSVLGFALVELVDGLPHLDEIDVHPAHGRRGIGRALVQAVCAWARTAGHAAVTLTTFRDIPWNAPFYARAGFRVVDPSALGPGLREVVADEARRGLDPGTRVVMRCEM